MRIRLTATVVVLCWITSSVPLLAHHSVAAKFEIGTAITIRGVVTKTEWMNPHALFWLEAKNDDGTASNWEMELPAPNALKRAGRGNFIKQGDEVSVSLWRAKDGSMVAHALTVTLPDGEILNLPRGWGVPSNSK
jgi:hypothetical protein